MSTKIITTETNYLSRNNQFKVIVNSRIVDDPGIRMTPRILLKRKQIELCKTLKEKDKIFQLIQYYQLLAIKTDDDIEARQSLEYVSMILKPNLCKIDNEIKALEIQIEKLRARL